MSAGSQLSGMFYQKLPAHTLLPARAGKSHSKTVCWKHWRSWGGGCWRYQCSNTDALALPNSSRLKGGRWQGVSVLPRSSLLSPGLVIPLVGLVLGIVLMRCWEAVSMPLGECAPVLQSWVRGLLGSMSELPQSSTAEAGDVLSSRNVIQR